MESETFWYTSGGIPEKRWGYMASDEDLCFLHNVPLPCRWCIAEQRYFQAEFAKLASTPGTILTSWDTAGPNDDYAVELKFRVNEDGSWTCISQRRYPPMRGLRRAH